MQRIRKNDTVQVIHGKDKGKQGTVIEIYPGKDKLIVQGIGIAVKHVKARKQGEVPSIKRQELAMEMSKVMPVCSSCKKACRISAKVLDDGKKVRICGRCKEIMR